MVTSKNKVAKETIPGFEKAGAEIEVSISSLGMTASTIKPEVAEKLAKVTMETLKEKLVAHKGVPLRYSKTLVEDEYRVEGKITFDETSLWGSLLDDYVVAKLLEAGCAVWYPSEKGGIQFTEKLNGSRLRELGLASSQVVKHKMFDRFWSVTGEKATENNIRTYLSRNK